jgi:membrane protease YdiL (CAAX protease family)
MSTISSSSSSIEARARSDAAVEAGRPLLIAVAWIATLLMSRLPEVFLRDVLAVDASWIHWLWLAVAMASLALTYRWGTIRSLRGYFAVMLVVLVATTLLSPLIAGSALWTSWFGGDAAWTRSFFGERLLLVLLALLVLGVLLAMGLKRGDLFLVRGGLASRKERIQWLVTAFLLGAAFLAFMVTLNAPSMNSFVQALPLLPAVLLFAGMNAFGEEFMYRAAPLSQLWRVVGARHAVLLTAVWFGLGHYYGGIPSGLFGAVQSGFLGWLLGRLMLQSRGFAWPWAIHVLLDVIIYVFLAMAAVAAGNG